MSEGKRKRSDDHTVGRFKVFSNQSQLSQTQTAITTTNPILQQPIIVNPIITEQVNDSEQIQLLNSNLAANQNAQSNLVYIILPPGVNQTQSLLQGVQTVLLVPKDDQNNPNNEPSTQIQYCLPYSETVESQIKKADEDVILIKDVKSIKEESGMSIEYLPPQSDPLQIQPDNTINCTVLPQYGEPALSTENIFILDNKQLHKIQHVDDNSASDILKPKTQFKCDYTGCILSFPSLYEKKIHADTHIYPANTEFKCNICNMPFETAPERNKHVDTHAIVSTFKCKYCSKTFPYYTSLVKHTNEDKCTNDKSHCCHYCGVQFVDIDDLVKHQKDNMKRCVCNAKLCSEPAFDLHTTLCTLYKQKMGHIRRPRVKSKGRNNNSSNEVIVLD